MASRSAGGPVTRRPHRSIGSPFTPTRPRVRSPFAPISPMRGADGQMLVIFAILLAALVAMSGLLIDGGMAWVNRRQAQNAADTGALAAATAFSSTHDPVAMTDAATDIAGHNGFLVDYVDCSGASRSDGVVVSAPPTTGTHAGADGYVEVMVNRPMRTTFSSIVGQECWMVSARAVAAVNSSGVATCTFCSLNNSNNNHTLVLKNSATLRVDGDIYVNSTSGGYTPGVCNPLTRFKACGDGFDVFGAGGYVSAKTITTVGGWETHDKNIAWADERIAGCTEWPNPPMQLKTSNVCIHQPPIADPLNDPGNPANIIRPPTPGAKPVAGLDGCPIGGTVPAGTAAAPALMQITGGTRTICPGTYYGGLKITGGVITMLSGVYIMVGGGLQVLNSAALDGSAGVLIYSTGGGSASQTTSTANDLVPLPIPGHVNLKAPVLVSSDSSSDPGQIVTFTVTLTPADSKTPLPSGLVDFYDGNAEICAASPVVQTGTKGNIGHATCVYAFGLWGTRSISAVYTGDTIYNPAGDTLTQTVKAPAGTRTGPITIQTTGNVKLSGPISGPYAGLTLFQERNSNLTITLTPGANSSPKCGPNFMTAGVPPDTSTPPEPCGALGGIQGTVYAPHEDALVLIEASGLANLQVIAGQIEVDSAANTRFGYDSSVFANGGVHLVE